MTSVEIVLFKGKTNKEGKHPIALRVIKDRKPSYKFLKYIHLKDWNNEKSKVKGSNKDYAVINNLCTNEKTRASNLILDFEAKNKPYTSSQIINILKKNGKTTVSFFEMANTFLDEINIPSKYNRYSTEYYKFLKIKRYLKDRDIQFEDHNV